LPPSGVPAAEKNGVMEEEWLVWDNRAFMKQIGLAK
jgi:hypothetical protein